MTLIDVDLLSLRAYDANKNKTAETIGGVMAPYGFTAGYDDEDRLASWTRADSNLTQGWNLTPVGDWQQFTENAVVQNRSHGPTHELTAINSTPLTYDAKGNLTTNSNGQTYTWDFDNKLVSATVPAGCPDGIEGTHTYSYDALGRRVSKTVVGADSTVFVCLTSPLQHSPFAGQELSEYTAAAAASNPLRHFVYASYIDDAVLQVNMPQSAPVKYFHHANDIFSRTAITDSTGSVLERYAHAPYGTRLVLDSSAQPLGPNSVFSITTGFTGRRHDPETSLAYYRARYVAPHLGRFIGCDPIGFVGSNWNLFEYCMSAPTMSLVDPSGCRGGPAVPPMRPPPRTPMRDPGRGPYHPGQSPRGPEGIYPRYPPHTPLPPDYPNRGKTRLDLN